MKKWCGFILCLAFFISIFGGALVPLPQSVASSGEVTTSTATVYYYTPYKN
ncbi:hypothetical protein ACP8HI_09360 [Paenibacillus sp. FA6]|uniref:hypothetical protein n=1 Tax=Paenibacillus sp. FA6 TaxID=3413029 RepID=UPI003F65FBB5